MNSAKNDIDDLIARSLTGEASQEEELQLKAWIAQSAANDQYFQELKRAARLVDHYYQDRKALPEINLDKEWDYFLNQTGTKKTGTVRKLQPTWLRIAASVLLLIASGFVINYFLTTRQMTMIETTVAMKEVTLPDGSKITLNQNSTLTYQPSFNKENRAVTLQGEAFFDIVRDENNPFIITVNETTVEVLGTSFNIRSYESDQDIEVTVATGKVKFSSVDQRQQVTLQAGDKGIYRRAQKDLSSQTNADINFIAWKTRKIVFRETGLREVVETLNRVYQANITISATVADTCLVTVSFDQQTLEAVLNVLKTTLNLEYRIQNGKIEITHTGC